MSVNNKNKDVSQLIRERDTKRETLSFLFEEKKKIMEQMKTMNEELLKLDDDIETLEESRDHSDRTESLQVKQEPVPSNETHSVDVRSEPECASPIIQHHPRERKQEPQLQDYHDNDLFLDDVDEYYSEGPSIRSNNDDDMSAKVPPLQFETGYRAKSDSSKPHGKVGGTIDKFFARTAANDRQNNQSISSATSPSSMINSSNGSMYSRHDIQQTLRQSFRLETFRENQLEIIRATLSGKDCFVLMKTGGGKSLLYQLPAVLEFPKITLVVSPLLSLIQDQEDQMNGFVRNSCVSFTSGMGVNEHNENWKKVRDVNAGVMMILVTPERVFKSNKLKSELQKLEEQNRLGRFVIDECHCACQWGHDFRPDYAKLQVLRQHFPKVPILALTATASEQVRNECIQILQLSRDHEYFRSSSNRPNLKYQVRAKDTNTIQDMVEFIKENHPHSAGIVYTYSRKDADTVAYELCEQGIIAEAYHSDVDSKRKRRIHQSWMKNRTQVVVATIAFGLGINKPDVRFVLHHTVSKTLEAYYQESGRAGRDGKPSDCVLYYSPKDVIKMMKMMHGDSTEELFIVMVRYAQNFGDDSACRSLILKNLGEPNQDVDTFAALSDGMEIRDVSSHAITIIRLLMHYQHDKVTMHMLISEWRKKPTDALPFVKNNPPKKDLSPGDCERVVIGLLVNKLIAPIYRYNKYGTLVYIECTTRGRQFSESNKAKMMLPLSKKVPKKRKSTPSTPSSEDGWIEKKSKRKRTSSASKSKKKTVTKKAATTTKNSITKRGKGTAGRKTKRKKTAAKSENEVIELIDDSDDDSILTDNGDTITRKICSRRVTASSISTLTPQTKVVSNEDSSDDLWNSDSENEFEG